MPMVRLVPRNSVYIASAIHPWLCRNTSRPVRFLLSLFLVARIAQSDRVACIVCAAFEQRDNVVPFRRKPEYPFLLAVNT